MKKKTVKRKKVDFGDINTYKPRSKCCNALATVHVSPDFIGDNSATQKIGTGYYICRKCLKPCDLR